MARSRNSEERSRWWLSVIGNVIAFPSAAVMAYEFVRVLGTGAVAVFSAVPISAQGLYAGGFALCVVILAYSNWFIIERIRDWNWRRRTAIKNEQEKKQQEVENVIEELIMRLGRGRLSYSPGDDSRVEILKRYLTGMGLAPPVDSNDDHWHYHFSRLKEFIKAYGIVGARAEMKGWYDSQDESK